MGHGGSGLDLAMWHNLLFDDTKPSGAYPRGMGNIHERKVRSMKPTTDLLDKN